MTVGKMGGNGDCARVDRLHLQNIVLLMFLLIREKPLQVRECSSPKSLKIKTVFWKWVVRITRNLFRAL